MTRRALGVMVATACMVASGLQFSTRAKQQAVFRSGVDLVAVETQVIDKDGSPIGNLDTSNFHVWINGKERRVVSADRIQYPLPAPRSVVPAHAEEPGIVWRSDVPMISGRVIIVAIDEMSFSTQALPAVSQTIRRFIGTLPPDDVVATFPYPFGTGRVDLTHFHTAAGLQLNRIHGLRPSPPTGDFFLTTSEAVDITSGDASVLASVYERECLAPTGSGCVDKDTQQPASGRNQGACSRRLHAFADGYAGEIESVSAASFSGLRDLLLSLPQISGPKTVILASAGLTSSDRPGGRPDVQGMMTQAGKFAAAADAMLYVLHFDRHFDEAFSASAPGNQYNSCMKAMFNATTHESRDADVEANGLIRMAGEAGGDYIRITAGTGEIALNRVLTETSAYYLLGVQPEAADRDGRTHFIRVQTIGVKGATVRARKEVTIPKSASGR